MRLALEKIRQDGGTQPRAVLDTETVDRYMGEMRDGAKFPPVVVFYDGRDYWLADGFHRIQAVEDLGWKDIAADVHQGTQRDAVLYSCGANALHGLPRTNRDKRRAVEVLLRDEEWSKKSDRWIAQKAMVGHAFVSKLRGQLSTGDSCLAPREGKDGKVRTMPPRPSPSSAMKVPGEDEPDEEEEPPSIRPARVPDPPESRVRRPCPHCSGKGYLAETTTSKVKP